MGSQQAAKGWNEVDIAAVIDRQGLTLYFIIIKHKTNTFGPVDSSSSNFHSTFKRILSLTIETIAYCSEKTIL